MTRRRGRKPAATPAEVAKAREGKAPPDSPQVVKPVQCPNCYTTDVKCDGSHDGVRYYRCRVCCEFTTGAWTRFKVTVAGTTSSVPADEVPELQA